MDRLSDFSCRRPQEDCPYLSIIRLIYADPAEEIEKEKSVSLKYQTLYQILSVNIGAMDVGFVESYLHLIQFECKLEV